MLIFGFTFLVGKIRQEWPQWHQRRPRSNHITQKGYD